MSYASAVIGCGRMGAFTSDTMAKFAPRCWFPLSHAQAILTHPSLNLTGLCDADPVVLSRAAQAYRVDAVFADPVALVESMRPLLVGIATRTHGRAAIIRAAAEGGVRAMHIEKPLCNSVAELRALEGVFSAEDLYCTYGTIRRFFRIFQRARELADSGVYGPLLEIRVNMGEGMLFWTHPHSVDLILFFAGERAVSGVQGRLANVVRGESAASVASDPVIVAASIYFDDGVVGHIGRAPGFSAALACRDGEITVVNDGQDISVLSRLGEDPYFSRHAAAQDYPRPASEGSYAPIAHLVECLDGDLSARTANRRLKTQILQGQEILFALVQSHWADCRPVRADQIDPDLCIAAGTAGKFA